MKKSFVIILIIILARVFYNLKTVDGNAEVIEKNSYYVDDYEW